MKKEDCCIQKTKDYWKSNSWSEEIKCCKCEGEYFALKINPWHGCVHTLLKCINCHHELNLVNE